MRCVAWPVNSRMIWITGSACPAPLSPSSFAGTWSPWLAVDGWVYFWSRPLVGAIERGRGWGLRCRVTATRRPGSAGHGRASGAGWAGGP
jgi:hypothetical protein